MRSMLVLGSQLPGYLRFRSALRRPEAAQLNALKNVIRALDGTSSADRWKLNTTCSYAQFSARVPVTDYADWEADILSQKQGGRPVVCHETKRYQPTSGSTSGQKWIPYSKTFLRELDAAIQAWIGDTCLADRSIFAGSQYWSLSWLPEDQRQSRPSTDDLELLPHWKRFLLAKLMAVPPTVTCTRTMEESQFATMAYLCSRSDLSLVSVWSPTFWLKLLDLLSEWRMDLAETLESGSWSMPTLTGQLEPPMSASAARLLRSFSGTELLLRLWPHLAMISCWDSASSRSWAQRIQEIHARDLVQGKGLLATEGVVTIPFQGKFVGAITSHFLEWLDLQDGRIRPTWELREGQTVQPLLTGGHGLLRYKLNDSLLVTGFLQETPTFEFTGRLRETDLVGEKLSCELVHQAFSVVENTTGIRPVSIFAIRTTERTPYYLALARSSKVPAGVLEESLESALSHIFHYKLARELGQLGRVAVHVSEQPESTYQQVLLRKGMVAGDIKIELLSEIGEHLVP